MPNTLEEKDWELLLGRIKDKECTPFLGAGTCFDVLPLGSKIANEWAQKWHYPLIESCDDLARVSQFLAIEYDPVFPKEEIRNLLKDVSPPNFKEKNEPHGLLADLKLPIYMTTNYDDFMFQALKDRYSDPKLELCRWNTYLKKNQKSLFDSVSGFDPTPANPLVFHLHGHYLTPLSMVLTEDDYLDFLVGISEDKDLLPSRILEAWAGTSLLFLGYRLADWDFRVLFRSIVSYLERSIGRAHISVQLVPGEDRITKKQKQKAQEYLNNYFNELKIKVFWGTCREFADELRTRWEAFNG